MKKRGLKTLVVLVVCIAILSLSFSSVFASTPTHYATYTYQTTGFLGTYHTMRTDTYLFTKDAAYAWTGSLTTSNSESTFETAFSIAAGLVNAPAGIMLSLGYWADGVNRNDEAAAINKVIASSSSGVHITETYYYDIWGQKVYDYSAVAWTNGYSNLDYPTSGTCLSSSCG